ncbi:MAG: GTP-binding protein [Lachnospiraceae bacterium]|nr:GTP-binding protein [Lachnospiraceae bacterium]
MIKIDLITGFLGSGKTTFIKRYARHLMDQGKRIAVLENDYGAINVDMLLLKELEGPQCDLEMVVGGNDYDCHKRRLKSKLIALGMLGYDRVLIEPSGVFDVDEFFDLLHEEPLNRWYEIGSVLCIIEAELPEVLTAEARYLIVSQSANAGKLVFSKTRGIPTETVELTLNRIQEAFAEFHCERRFRPVRDVITREWDAFDESDWKKIEEASYTLYDHVKLLQSDEYGFRSLFYMEMDDTPKMLEEKIGRLMKDKAAGQIFRIKGFARDEEERWFELNAAGDKIDVQPIPEGQRVIIVIGENLNQEAVNAYWDYRIGTGKTNYREGGEKE